MTFPARWTRWAPLLLLALAAFAAYANSLQSPFVFDDLSTIRDNPSIRHVWPPGAALAAPPVRGATSSGRPLVSFSLAINYALGGDSVLGYHVFNLLVHVFAAWALFGLLRTIFPKVGASDGAALAAALLWTVHPLATEAVTYTVQRAEAMMALCYLLTLYGFARGRLFLSWCACLAGMACKEVMVSAPLVVLLYDRTFASGTFAEAWRRHRAYYAALAATWLLLAWEVAAAGNRGGTAGFGGQVSPWAYLLTQFPAIVHYFRLCIWPAHLIFDYGTALTTSPAAIIPGAAVVMTLFIAGLWALRVRPALGFAVTAFFALLAPSSSIVPIPTEVAAEHRMYLPLAIVVATLVAWLARWLKREPIRDSVNRTSRAAGSVPGHHSGAVSLGAVAIVSLALLLGTILRNRDYRSAERLWRSAVTNGPANARAHTNLGFELGNQGRYAEAISEFTTALHCDPSFADAENNLGSADLELDDLASAAKHFGAAERLAPKLASPHYNLGALAIRAGDTASGLAEYAEALSLEPASPEAHSNYAHSLAELKRYDEAITQCRQALQLRPSYPEALNVLGSCYLFTHRPAEALASFRAALALAPPPLLAATLHFNLGNLAQSDHRLPAAISEYRAALALNPNYARAHSNLGAALFRGGETSAAIAEFQTALRLDPALADARSNLAAVREFERARRR